MDIETYKQESGKLVPYLLCWAQDDGRIKMSDWIKDFGSGTVADFNDLLLNVIKDLCIRKYKNYKIHMHNFSKFDGVFY